MGFKGNNLPQATKGWRIVDRNLEKIYNLTMNLLAYSRPREPQLEPVNPRQVMAVADVDADVPAVPLDADGLHQVLMNLLTNSLDAVEPLTGLIRVVCRYDAEDKQTILEVIDNGPGIPPGVKSHLFELFHSTKGNRGTGIGLAVVKKIIDEHEGQISVRSSKGEGTTFTITLPAFHANIQDPSHTHHGITRIG